MPPRLVLAPSQADSISRSVPGDAVHGAPVSVVILSNSELRAAGLEQILSGAGLVVGSHVHAPAGPIPADSDTDEHVFVLDAPVDQQGLATITNLRRLHGSAHIALLCDHCDRHHLRLAFMAGVDAVLSWSSSPAALVSMLRLIAAGERFIPSPLVTELVEAFGSREGQAAGIRHGAPLEREFAILRCLADGCSNKEIAVRLGIGIATVRLHVRTLLRKLGSLNRTQAAIWAISHGFGSRTS